MYAYYNGNGFYGILLGRICNLIILGFLVGFSLFLLYCVDWSFVGRPATAAEHPTLAGVTDLYGFLRYMTLFDPFLMSFIECLYLLCCAQLPFMEFLPGRPCE